MEISGNSPPASEVPVPKSNGYRLQIRESAESEWRNVGQVDTDTGLTCGRLLANNQCPGFKTVSDWRVRLVDADGNTVWMMD